MNNLTCSITVNISRRDLSVGEKWYTYEPSETIKLINFWASFSCEANSWVIYFQWLNLLSEVGVSRSTWGKHNQLHLQMETKLSAESNGICTEWDKWYMCLCLLTEKQGIGLILGVLCIDYRVLMFRRMQPVIIARTWYSVKLQLYWFY